MEVASSPSLRLAPRQTYELTEDTPVTLGEGEADLYLALPDGRQRFVVALPVGALLPVRAGEAIVEQSRQAVTDDKAEVICLGCGGMAELEEQVRAATGVPIVDGVRSAVTIAEGHVRMGLSTSKVRTYATPREKKVTGWPFKI